MEPSPVRDDPGHLSGPADIDGGQRDLAGLTLQLALDEALSGAPTPFSGAAAWRRAAGGREARGGGGLAGGGAGPRGTAGTARTGGKHRPWLCLRLAIDGRVSCAIGFAFPRPRTFDGEELSFL